MTNMKNSTSWELWSKIQKLSRESRRIVIALINLLLKKDAK